MSSLDPSEIPMSAAPLGYVRELDGLRAVAVVGVMLSHVHPTAFKGGAIGVDIFFALSGFLISVLVLEELQRHSGSYGFRSFYARRSLRLFPALYASLTLVAVYLAVRWTSLPRLLLDAGVENPAYRRKYFGFLAAAGTYTTNLGSFAEAPANLVGHTWSLAFEEQFYLVWPGILVLIWRKKRLGIGSALLASFVLVCIVARACRLEWAESHILWMRPEAVAVGCLAAIVRSRSERARRFVIAHALPILVASGVIIAGAAATWNHSAWRAALDRGGFSLVALACGGLVLVVSTGGLTVARPLATRPLVWIGTMSYGLYLWHLPVFRIVAWELPDASGAATVVLRMSLSLAVAVASFRWIERPFRRRQHQHRRR